MAQPFSLLSLEDDGDGGISVPPVLAGLSSDKPIKVYYEPSQIIGSFTVGLTGAASFYFFSSLQDPDSNISTDTSGAGLMGLDKDGDTMVMTNGSLTYLPNFTAGQNFFYIQFFSDSAGLIPIDHTATVEFSIIPTGQATATFTFTPGACLFEDCTVEMLDKSFKRICDLKIGDLIRTPTTGAAIIDMIHTNHTLETSKILRFGPGSLGDKLPTSELIITDKHSILIDGKFLPASTWKDKSSVVEKGKYRMFQLVTFPHQLAIVSGVWVSTFSKADAALFRGSS